MLFIEFGQNAQLTLILKLPWETGYWKEFFSGPGLPKDVKDWKAVEPPLLFLEFLVTKPETSKKCKRSQPKTWHTLFELELSRDGRISVRPIFSLFETMARRPAGPALRHCCCQSVPSASNSYRTGAHAS